jgi:hypothetical protein
METGFSVENYETAHNKGCSFSRRSVSCVRVAPRGEKRVATPSDGHTD